MRTIPATQARDNLYRRALRETIYLLSIPGMRESIREGLATPLEDCVEKIEW